MHAVALAYPETPSNEEKKAAFQFFNALEYLLPCESCKQNYRKELQMFPLQPALESKQKLNEWLTALHNSVNKRLNKTVMSDEQVLEYVFADTKQHTTEPTSPAAISSTTTPTDTTSSTNNTWGITATAVAGLLLVVIIVLLVISGKNKQKKVLRK
jgi:hypothetical protein